MKRFIGFLLVAVLFAGVGLAGTVDANNTPDTSTTGNTSVEAQTSPIRVGSKLDTEGQILGYLIYVALEDAGYDVENQINLGASSVVRDALLGDEIDVYPEYTGTAINNYFRAEWLAIPEGTSNNAYQSYALVSTLDMALNDVIWMEPAPLNNTFALAISREFSEENGITSVADLAVYVNAGNEARLTTSDEFAQRPDGLASFEETYGFDLEDDQLMVMAGATPSQTQQALVEGEGNIAMAYGTDGTLVGFGLVVLSDELGAQPVYQPAPIFRGDVVRENPEIAGILGPIFRSLDAETMQGLNARVSVAGENPEDVARDYLESNGFIE